MGDEGAEGDIPGAEQWEALRQALCRQLPTVPQFHGLDHEDPERFITRCTEYFEALHIPDERRTRTASKGLKGAAETWFRACKEMDLDWDRLAELLRLRFNSRQIKSEIAAKLYGVQQGEKEPVGPFLQRKYMLFQRVRPTEDEATKVEALIGTIKPSIRRFLRSQEINDYAGLLTIALQLEADENDSRNKAKGNTTKMIPSETNNGKNKDRQQSSNPKCRFCPEYHWHRDCPVFQKRQSGNWRSTEATPALSAVNPEHRE